MKPKLIAMIMVLLLAAAQYTSMAYAAAEAELGDDTTEVYVYEEIKAAAEARRDELLYLLELELPPEILDKLEEALYTLDEAEGTVDTKEATELYIYALKLFRNIWQEYISYSPEAAKESLEDIDEDDKPSPEESEPPEGLEEEIMETKEKRLIKIQEEIHWMITAMSEHIDDLKGYLSEGDSKVLEKAIENEEKKLERIMDKVSKGQYEDAIDELIETEFKIEDDIDEMEDKEAAKILKKVEKLQSQAQKKENITEEGEDDSEDDDTIDSVEEELEKIKKEYKDKVDEAKQKNDTDKKDKDKKDKDK